MKAAVMGGKERLRVFIFFTVALLLCLQFAFSRSIIRSLPGFDGPLPFEIETGYVGVDAANDVQLFYYFVKSERNPREDPVILWIDGGPGCSSFTGLATEIGPLKFKISKYDGALPNLLLAPHSWTKVSNVIFLDSPVGTGFSYSRTLHGFETSDTKFAKEAYIFLKKWFVDHHDFLQNPLYIAGLSYSGIPIPIIALEISDGNEAGIEPLLNLKGYLLGNPGADRHTELNALVPFAHGMRMISDELYELVKKHCNEEYINVDPSNVQCLDSLQVINKCIAHINAYHILEPLCPTDAIEPKAMKRAETTNSSYSMDCVNVSCTIPPYPDPEHMISKANDMEQERSIDEYSHDEHLSPLLPSNPVLECKTYVHKLSYYWANDDTAQRALNVREGTIDEWIRCKELKFYKKELNSTVKYHKTLSTRGYRSLIFSGDHDAMVPSFGTEAWMKSLGYPVVDEWRPWYTSGQISGYTRSYANNMTFATVKGAGHEAPLYKPKECFAMFERWISNHPL